MKIGVHPMNLHLRLAELWPAPFADMDVEFVSYPEGRDTGKLIAEGRLAVGGTGSTPPLISQSEGLPVIYLAASAPRPANGAILVAVDSPIATLDQLKGKRVALIDGSFHTYLLARSLEQAGLRLTDVQRCEMSPQASREALARGEVDVWIAMAPMIDQTIEAGETRLLTLCGSTIPNRSVFWTLRDAEATSNELEGFVAGLVALGRQVSADPDRAVALLAGKAPSAEARAAWKGVVMGRDWTVVPASPSLVAEQQEEADVLHAHGDFAAPLKIESFRAAVGAA
ncbi:ABC transporter substrate-binding protein [Amorphus orientalis]|uniref:ABC transporter substrate-binding protein n=1 Tax=Amorphus orientalis TaxID=649198 RepID=UPI0027D8BFEF|nr:ABC transporter substrate-binding protein [Amorphus orientalis]